MKWKIEKIINYEADKLWGFGHSQFGFYDRRGNLIVIDNENNRIGQLDTDGESFAWSAGVLPFTNCKAFFHIDLRGPVYSGDPGDGTYLVSSYENSIIYRIDPINLSAVAFIEGSRQGITDLHNCEPDEEGNIWINSVTSHVVRCFNQAGKLLFTLGEGPSEFQSGPVPWDQVKFGNIFDLRRGPDGIIYVLDSGNFCVRKIDIREKLVTTVAGIGTPGYTGDGGPATEATLGGNSKAEFNGPWSLAIDENSNIYIGDTQNGVIRMVDNSNGIISTIAGKPNPVPGQRNKPAETDPFMLNLPKICSLDYYDKHLFIPEWDGDLIILKADLE